MCLRRRGSLGAIRSIKRPNIGLAEATEVDSKSAQRGGLEEEKRGWKATKVKM